MTHSNQDLTDENFELYAAKHYANRQCLDIKEFQDDILKFKYLRKLFRRYANDGELQERLILNHLIILYNVFPPAAANRMIFFKLDLESWPAVKTFLLFLNYIPNGSYDEIPIDIRIANRLKTL